MSPAGSQMPDETVQSMLSIATNYAQSRGYVFGPGCYSNLSSLLFNAAPRTAAPSSTSMRPTASSAPKPKS